MSRGDLVATVTAGGTLNAVVLVEVGSQVSGQIQELFVDFNSAVTRGDLIARIDPAVYEAKVAQSQAELAIAEAVLPVQRAQIERNGAELDNARAALAGAQAQTARGELAVGDAKRDLDRKRPLANRAIVAASDLERVESTFYSARAQLAAFRAQEVAQRSAIRAAEAGMRMAEAQVANVTAQIEQRKAILRQAQIDLERTDIRAPVTGTVVGRNINRGQTVAASLQAPTLFTIAQDLKEMQVEASVVEADVSRFALDQPVTFTVDAHPGREFAGRVKQIRKSPQTVQNVVTYTVVISTDNADEALLPGMTANLKVVVARRLGVLRVPNAALRFRPLGHNAPPGSQDVAGRLPPGPGLPGNVFAVGPGHELISVPLRLGATDGRTTEVLAGDLAEGQGVVIAAARSDSPASSNPLTTFRLQ